MLGIDLGRLWREGSVQVEAGLPDDSSLWDESGLAWAGPVDVDLTVTEAGTGEIVVRGSVQGVLAQECRRCLEAVETEFEHELTAVFVASDAPGAEDDDDIRVYDPGEDFDLAKAVREEVILAVDAYVVCDPECKGLCPHCGTNRNEQTCDCSVEELDPRWERLRALKEK